MKGLAAVMLESLRDQLAEIEATNDLAWKRRIIELLVDRVDVETTALPDGKMEARLEVRYVFGRPRRLRVDGGVAPVTSPDEPAFASGCPKSWSGGAYGKVDGVVVTREIRLGARERTPVGTSSHAERET